MSLRGRGLATRVLFGVGCVMALFLVVRGIAEPFVIDVNDPGSYRNDWGGPSLVGVLAVHSGPAVAILLAALFYVRRSGGRRPRGT
jgi:hypothetical protein